MFFNFISFFFGLVYNLFVSFLSSFCRNLGLHVHASWATRVHPKSPQRWNPHILHTISGAELSPTQDQDAAKPSHYHGYRWKCDKLILTPIAYVLCFMWNWGVSSWQTRAWNVKLGQLCGFSSLLFSGKDIFYWNYFYFKLFIYMFSGVMYLHFYCLLVEVFGV